MSPQPVPKHLPQSMNESTFSKVFQMHLQVEEASGLEYIVCTLILQRKVISCLLLMAVKTSQLSNDWLFFFNILEEIPRHSHFLAS